MREAAVLDALDRAIIDSLQGDFPICERPYAEAAQALGIGEETLLDRLQNMLDRRLLTRFGPMFQIEQMGGAFVLAAMCVSQVDWERVVDLVNAFPEVAHNYRRESWRLAEDAEDKSDESNASNVFRDLDELDELNMWFVLATETPDGIGKTVAAIEAATGLSVYSFPKLKEYFVEMKLEARG